MVVNALWLVVYSITIFLDKMLLYDDVDEEVLRCYHEMALANLIYFTLKEGACSEQSSRMTAMDSASKNAGINIYIHNNIIPCSLELT